MGTINGIAFDSTPSLPSGIRADRVSSARHLKEEGGRGYEGHKIQTSFPTSIAKFKLKFQGLPSLL